MTNPRKFPHLKAASKSIGVLLIALVIITGFSLSWKYQAMFSDNAPNRGAEILSESQFGDGFTLVYPSENFSDWDSQNTATGQKWQGWSTEQSMWYYNATQGSALLPYDFFIHIEQASSEQLFRANANMDKYRYIPQQASKLNPDALPLGMVKDTYQDKTYLGFTCAACHTNQIVYNKTAIRVDGAPAMANMDQFMIELEAALTTTLNQPSKKARFIERILLANQEKSILETSQYDTSEQVEEDLKKYATQVSLYNFVNRSATQYGYARLDAFGRIFNRVLQHTLNKKHLTKAINNALPEQDAEQVLAKLDNGIVNSNEITHLLETFVADLNLNAPTTDSESQKQQLASLNQLRQLKDELFNPANAPVSYPFLWDIAQHDYVQWNGIAANAGVGAVGRNTGEVMGVFAILDWKERQGWNFSTLLGNQVKNENGAYTDFTSSVDVNNLRLIESQLKSLQSPIWPEAVLPKIDKTKAKLGKKLFVQHCQSCHLGIERDNPNRKVVAQMSQLSEIQTDSQMAKNSTSYTGYSGIVEGIYLPTEVGNILLEEKTAVASILTSATKNVVATPDPDKGLVNKWLDWVYNLGATFFDNDIKESIKRGNYQADTTADPFASLNAYKARPLNGIWATAPYLHNGSVPSLYQLLLPKCSPAKFQQETCRPEQFIVGSRKFDPVKVGFVSQGYEGFVFDTSKVANSNAGHEYGTQDITLSDGNILPALTDDERWLLVEYMKSL
ncbi:di-heme-cytochrome C peroxidase [Catenovulum maritimum]|uniref:Ribonuclease E n=1 Tax=Catenovulum maritimum TaxID=1513271 RepID=A0A0J8GZX4_9ALTE|nr:di-heme-cytochrome C peroxidase [Catenovulum maritimum]KMT66784.1 ribonuclease E [Catenovulum maritimum]